MINRLDNLHKKGYLHGNIGLKSFSYGLEEPDILYLADFYYSRQMATNEMRITVKTKFPLNITFASQN
jgi:hypothetical protein